MPADDNTLETIEGSKDTVGASGASFYFHPATLAKGKEFGLDGFRWYVLGRGGVLGNVEAPVVQSAFGYFSAGLIDKIWNSAKEKMDPREAGTAYMQCCADLGRSKLADVEGLDAYNEAASAVIAAADPAGLALFAGIAAEERATDAPGLALQNTAILRELRGSAHLVALLASGLDAAQAHAIKRPDDVATFGYDPAPVISADGPAKHEAAEALTSQMLIPAYSVLDSSGGNAIVDGAVSILAAVS